MVVVAVFVADKVEVTVEVEVLVGVLVVQVLITLGRASPKARLSTKGLPG